MTAHLKPYPAYRASGVVALGDIPTHWDVVRLKNWLVINRAVLPEDTDPEYSFDYLDIGSVATGRLVEEPRRIRFRSAPSRARRIIKEGDTIVSTVRTYLKAVWHANPGLGGNVIGSTGFAVLTPRPRIEPRFVSYVCRSVEFTDQVSARSVGTAYPAIGDDALGALKVCVPSLEEQVRSTRVLDRVEECVEDYIRAKERLIALLEEQKQALIHEAVTGKIDVRTGRPYPAYKDSGVEWLGKVPEPWEVVALKQLSRRIQNGATPPTASPAYYENGTIPWYGPSSCGPAEEVGRPVGQLNPVAFAHRVARIVTGPAILIVVIGSAGRMVLMLNEGSTNQQITAYEIETSGVCPRFLLRQLRLAKEWVRSTASSATLPILNSNVVDRLKCAVPSLAEQDSISGFLRSHMGAIDQSLVGASRQIALLREYRTRLISDVVTGKLDVRGMAPLPESEAGIEAMVGEGQA